VEKNLIGESAWEPEVANKYFRRMALIGRYPYTVCRLFSRIPFELRPADIHEGSYIHRLLYHGPYNKEK
jgi:hypothetical protein